MYMIYPLKQVWINTKIQCQFITPYPIPAFSSNTYYCINNDYQHDQQHLDRNILSVRHTELNQVSSTASSNLIVLTFVG